MSDFATLLAQEQALIAAGHVRPCGHRCATECHGQLVCLRAEHPHTAEQWAPHHGFQPDGVDEPVQWVCLPEPTSP